MTNSESTVITDSSPTVVREVVFPHPVPRRWVVDMAFVLLAIMIGLGTTIMYVSIHNITTGTNSIVTKQVPDLKRQIAEERQRREDDEYILTQQAVPAIERLAGQVKALGGDPGEVVLKPPEHPTTTTTTPGK